MKKLLIITAFIAVAATAKSQDVWQNPAITGQNKELPRTLLVGYPTAEAAFAYGESPYTRPVELEWVTEMWPDKIVYKTRYKIPFGWIDRQSFLRIAYIIAPFDLYMNGQYVGYSQSGCTPTEFDVTKFSQEGFNELEIRTYPEAASCKLDNFPDTPKPIMGITMFAQPRIRVRDVVIDATVGADGTGIFAIGAVVKSHLLNEKTMSVSYQLLAPDGKMVSAGKQDATFSMRGEDTLRFFDRIADVSPWGPTTGPNLYTLLIKTRFEGRDAEFFAVNVGFHNIAVESGVLKINGVPVDATWAAIRPTGNKITDLSAITALRNKGAGIIKILPGGVLTDELFDACDRLGIYLCPEAAISVDPATQPNPANDPALKEACIDRQMINIHTAKMHPSAIMFSMAEKAANGMNLYDGYQAVKPIAGARPVIFTGAEGQWNTDATVSSEGKLTFK